MSSSVLDEVIQKSFKDIAIASASSTESGKELDVSVVDRWRAVRTLVCRPGALVESSSQAATVVAEALNGTVGWCIRAAFASQQGTTSSDDSRVGALVAACLWMAENTTKILYEPRSAAVVSSASASQHGPSRRRPPMPAAAALWLSSRLLRSLLLAQAPALQWIRKGEAASTGTGRCPLVAVVRAALSAAARGCRSASSGRSGVRRACESGLVHMLLALCADRVGNRDGLAPAAAQLAASSPPTSTAAPPVLQTQWRGLQAAGWDLIRALLLRADCVEAWRAPGVRSTALWQLAVAAEHGRQESRPEKGTDTGDKKPSRAGRKRGRAELQGSSSSGTGGSSSSRPVDVDALRHRPFVHVALDALRELVVGGGGGGGGVPSAVQRAYESAVASASKHGLLAGAPGPEAENGKKKKKEKKSKKAKKGAASSSTQADAAVVTQDGAFLGPMELLQPAPAQALRMLPRLAREVLQAAAAAGSLGRSDLAGPAPSSQSLSSSAGSKGKRDGAAAVARALGLRKLNPGPGLGLVAEFLALAAPWILHRANEAANERAGVRLSEEAEEELLLLGAADGSGVGGSGASTGTASGRAGRSKKRARKEGKGAGGTAGAEGGSAPEAASLSCVAGLLALAREFAVYLPEAERAPYPQQCMLRFVVRASVESARAAGQEEAGSGGPEGGASSSSSSWWGRDQTLLDPASLPAEVRAFAGAIAAQALRARWVSDEGYRQLAALCPAPASKSAAQGSSSTGEERALAEGLAQLVAAAADVSTTAVESALEPALAPLLLGTSGHSAAGEAVQSQASQAGAIVRAVRAFARLRLLPRAWRALLAVAQAPLAATERGQPGASQAARRLQTALESPSLSRQLSQCAREAPLGQVEAMSLLTTVALGRASRVLLSATSGDSGSSGSAEVSCIVLAALVPLQTGLLSLLGAQSSSGRASASRCLRLLRRSCLEPLAEAQGSLLQKGGDAASVQCVAVSRCLLALFAAAAGTTAATGAVVAVAAVAGNSGAAMEDGDEDAEDSDSDGGSDGEEEDGDALAAAADGVELSAAAAQSRASAAGTQSGGARGVATAVAEQARASSAWLVARGEDPESLWWLLGGRASAPAVAFKDVVRGAGLRGGESSPLEAGWVPPRGPCLAAVEARLMLLEARGRLVPGPAAAVVELLDLAGVGGEGATAALGAAAAAHGLEAACRLGEGASSGPSSGAGSVSAGRSVSPLAEKVAGVCADRLIELAWLPGISGDGALEASAAACESVVRRGFLRRALVRRAMAVTETALRTQETRIGSADPGSTQSGGKTPKSAKKKGKDKKKDKKARTPASASSAVSRAADACSTLASGSAPADSDAMQACIAELELACEQIGAVAVHAGSSSSSSSDVAGGASAGAQASIVDSDGALRLPGALLADASPAEAALLLRAGAALACAAATSLGHASTDPAASGAPAAAGPTQAQNRFELLLWVLRALQCGASAGSRIHEAHGSLCAAARAAIAMGPRGAQVAASIAASVSGGGTRAAPEIRSIFQFAADRSPSVLLQVASACAPWTLQRLCGPSQVLEGAFPVDEAVGACRALPVRGRLGASEDAVAHCLAVDASLAKGVAAAASDATSSAAAGGISGDQLAVSMELLAGAAAIEMEHAFGSEGAPPRSTAPVQQLVAKLADEAMSSQPSTGSPARLALALARASPILGGATHAHLLRRAEKAGDSAEAASAGATAPADPAGFDSKLGPVMMSACRAEVGKVAGGPGGGALSRALAKVQAALGTCVLAASPRAVDGLLTAALGALRSAGGQQEWTPASSASSSSSSGAFEPSGVLVAIAFVRCLLACGPSSAHAGTRRILGSTATSACAAVARALGEWPGGVFPTMRAAGFVMQAQLAGVALARPALVPMEARDVAAALQAAEGVLDATCSSSSSSSSCTSSSSGAWGPAGLAAVVEAGRAAARHRSRLLADAFPALSSLLGRIALAVAVPPASCEALASGKGGLGGAEGAARRWCAGRAARLVEALPSLRSGARPLVVCMLVQVLRGLSRVSGRSGRSAGEGVKGEGEIALAGVTPAAEDCMAFVLALLDEARPAQLQGAFDGLAGDGGARGLLRALHKRWSAERRFRASAL